MDLVASVQKLRLTLSYVSVVREAMKLEIRLDPGVSQFYRDRLLCLYGSLVAHHSVISRDISTDHHLYFGHSTIRQLISTKTHLWNDDKNGANSLFSDHRHSICKPTHLS